MINTSTYENKEDLLSDLNKLLNTPEGFRFFTHHLQAMGACSEVEIDDTTQIVQKNIAETLLNTMARASPQACIKLMAQLRNIPTT